jgi:hypothetical protein
MYGMSIEAVSIAFSTILHGRDEQAWDKMLDDFSAHQAFLKMEQDDIQDFLKTYGAKRLVHGHTPVHKMTGVQPQSVTRAYVYADGLCVNVDHCLYGGGDGFVYTI